MIKAVIFDIGGVLIEWNDQWIIDDIKNTLLISEETARRCWERHLHPLSRGEISEQEFWTLFCSDAGVNVSNSLHDVMMREFINRFQPNQAVISIAQRLKKNGYRIAILSNSIEPHLNFLRSKNIDDDFEFAVYSSEVGVEKPDREIYELTLAKVGLPAEETVFIDNVEGNIVGAQKVGMRGIVYTTDQQLEQDLRILGVRLS